MRDQDGQPNGRAMNDPVTGDSINAKAKMAREGNEQAVRQLADEIFNTTYFAEIPEEVRLAVKERVVRQELVYRQGAEGTREEDVAMAVNRLADKLELPAYTKTSPFQVRMLRATLRNGYPNFIAQGTNPQNTGLKKAVGTRLNPDMSPLEAVFGTAVLLQQKMRNTEYQLSPKDYAKNIHKKEVEQWQAARRGQMSVKAPEQPFGFSDASKYQEIRDAVARKVVKMSMADLLTMPDELLDNLRIER
jgi:ribosomal protein S12 methylthiotransferase accessory factor YcaO